MGRGGKVVGQRNFKKRVRSNDEGSDDSDEDYVIENEERGSGDESVEYASSGEGDCSSEEEVRVSGRVVGSDIRRRRSSLGRKRRKVTYEEDEDYVKVEDDENDDDDGGGDVRAANKTSRSKENVKSGGNSLRKRRTVSYEEDRDYVDFEDDDYDDEDDDKDDEDYVKVRASKRSKGCLGNGAPGSGKRRKGLYEEDEDEDYVNGIDDEEDDGDVKVRVDKRRRNNDGCLENGKTRGKNYGKRKESCEEDEDEDYVNVDDCEEEDDDDDYDGEDEELALCDDDCLDEEEEEEEEVVVKRSRNVKMAKKKSGTKRGAVRSKRTRTNSRVPKKPVAKKGRLRKKVRYQEEDDDEDDCNVPAREKSKKTSRRRKYTVNSDSDSVASGSEREYTISEEEREQVKEAERLFGGGGSKKASLRSSSSADNNQHLSLLPQDKTVARKGKEKVNESDSKPEAAAKQVCGICLSEEDKRKLRGTLDCCSHYFCFKCITEWSKVESRCPLCKQRFTTITKNGRLSGMDMRSVVIEVPKRDQVYQPTEEEIRSFIDPYEQVECTECHQGGDDAHMLLCDLCDSSAHTYCVGLGQQVPDGNWYCYGCRPAALSGSSSSQNLVNNISSEQRPTMNNRFSSPMPVTNRLIRQTPVSDTSDRPPAVEDRSRPISESSTFPQVFGSPAAPGFPMGDAASATSGAGAQTLSGRREIQRRIQTLLSSRMMMATGVSGVQAATNIQRIQSLLSSRMNALASGVNGIRAPPANVYSGFPATGIARNGEMPARNLRTHDTGVLGSNAFIEGRSQNSNSFPSSLIGNREILGFRPSQWRPAHQEPAIDRSVSLTLWPENSGINPVPGYGQENQYNNRSTNRLGVDFPPYGVNNNQLYILKEQLQSMVISHLKVLSRDIELGQETMSEIVRASTNTVMAHCGLEHESNEVQPLPPLPSRCTHVDRIASGQASIMRGFCSSCFESFVSDVVKKVLDSRVPTRLPQWLSLGL